MSRKPSKMESDLSTLRAIIETTLTLLSQFSSSAKALSSKPEHVDAELAASAASLSIKSNTKTAATFNALVLAHDCACLLKAHSTKLSLLMINEPFTPTAICTILRELSVGPLPGLASAVEICDEIRYTRFLRKELTFAVGNAFNKLTLLIQEIPLNGKSLKKGEKGGLASTGVVWEACDSLIGLKNMGIGGFAVKKVEQYRECLKDAIEELKEWGDEEPGDNEADDNGGNGEVGDAQDQIDAVFGDTKNIPQNDPNKIRERLESSLKRLQTIHIMYSAVIKRRFRTLPPLPQRKPPSNSISNSVNVAQTLDEVLEVLRKIPNNVDELACAFYELDAKEIDRRMDDCFLLGWSAVELLVKNWQGETDDFSEWAKKFGTILKKGDS